ncbi:MAG: MFS family permease [Paracoccaceae bacterium]|jgi:MFS family permease
MQTPMLLDGVYSWRRLGLSLLIAVIGNVGMWSIIVILPGVQTEFAVGRADAALPYMMTMAGFAIGNLMIGRAVDRIGISRVLAGAGALLGVGFVLASLAPNLWFLAAVQLAIGFGTAATFGPLIADVSHWFLRRRGIAIAIVASGNYLSGAIWPLALSGVLERDGWRAVCVALAVLTAGAMLPLSLTLRRRLPQSAAHAADAHARSNVRAAAMSPRALTWLLALAGFACCMAMAMPQVHIVALCVDLGFGPAVGAEMLSLMLIGGVFSRVLSGLAADRWGGTTTLLVGSSLQCMALALYLPFNTMTPLYVVSLVFGLAQGGIVPSYAVIVRDYLPAREAGARVGFVIMATIVGMAVGGWVSGWIYDLTGSYQMAFLSGIGWNLLNIAVVGLLIWRGRGRGAAALA